MTFLLGYEDAIGYMPGPLSFDKDGIRYVAICFDMTTFFIIIEIFYLFFFGLYDIFCNPIKVD
tara:strand:- start:4957 stop:5145 length:189 start_codon:yes stop_codon:yes gene_type:complete